MSGGVGRGSAQNPAELRLAEANATADISLWTVMGGSIVPRPVPLNAVHDATGAAPGSAAWRLSGRA